MKKSKKIIISIIILLLVLFSVYFIFTKEDKDTTLNLIDKQWIEKNKNNVIDMGVINYVPVFNNNGSGVFFDFLKSLEKVTELSFNPVPFNYLKESSVPYSFNVTRTLLENDILLYTDNFVLLTKDNKKIETDEIVNYKIGLINDDLAEVGKYLNLTDNVVKTFETYSELLTEINKDTEGDATETNIDAIVVPRLLYFKEIVESDNLFISYQISEIKDYYVIKLGDNERLNSIIKKYYKKWALSNFEDKFNNHFSNNYFSFKNYTDKERVSFKGKTYTYGFVLNTPYDSLIDNKLYGYNSAFISSFAKLSDIDVSYKKYKNYSELYNAINTNKIDFMASFNDSNYDMDVNDTINVFNNKFVIASDTANFVIINSLKSLNGEELMTVANTALEKYLKENEVKVKTYDNIYELIDKASKNSIIAIDQDSYEFFKQTSLKNYKVDYESNVPHNYRYIIRDIKDNRIFSNFFNFYLSFLNNKEIISKSNHELVLAYNAPNIKNNLFIVTVLAFGIGLGITVMLHIRKIKSKRKSSISKEDKLKYIDMLTSLKNRNYLNENLEKWDESEVYPQAIMVIDLNNVAYINDNYGHSEGDNVIREAANILIQNQEENSDIIRTSGNEFLIYLVGHDEKSIVSIKRKLSKEFKELSHGFGAAIGYSMIIDGIKTIDDAINEATLDMRENKESSNI